MESQADELFYGGAAGGGKTDLLLGLALTQHVESIVFRREYTRLKGLYSRSRKIIGQHGRLNEQSHVWTLPDRSLEFGAVKDESDKENYQGRPHDFIGFDEGTQFTETQYLYITAWNRSAIPGQRCRVVITGNPPSTIEGLWIVDYFAPWLDDTHPNPALPGELRWFATIDDKCIEVPGPEPFEHNGELVFPLSRTFVPALLSDNPYYGERYRARLQGLKEPMRSQLLYGDFTVGLTDDPYQLISTVSLREAKAKPIDPTSTATITAGIDVAAGGEDETVVYLRRGWDVLDFRTWTDADPREEVIAYLKEWIPLGLKDINVDRIGVGHYFYRDLIKLGQQFKLRVFGINVGLPSHVMAENGDKMYANVKAEDYWSLRERFDEGEIRGLTDQMTINQLASIRYTTPKGITTIESKDDMRKRGLKSPDRGEAFMLAYAKPDLSLLAAMAIGHQVEPEVPMTPEEKRLPWNQAKKVEQPFKRSFGSKR